MPHLETLAATAGPAEAGGALPSLLWLPAADRPRRHLPGRLLSFGGHCPGLAPSGPGLRFLSAQSPSPGTSAHVWSRYPARLGSGRRHLSSWGMEAQGENRALHCGVPRGQASETVQVGRPHAPRGLSALVTQNLSVRGALLDATLPGSRGHGGQRGGLELSAVVSARGPPKGLPVSTG